MALLLNALLEVCFFCVLEEDIQNFFIIWKETQGNAFGCGSGVCYGGAVTLVTT